MKEILEKCEELSLDDLHSLLLAIDTLCKIRESISVEFYSDILEYIEGSDSNSELDS